MNDVIPISEIKNAGYNVAVSDIMIEKIREWGEIYENKASWFLGDMNKRITSLELPAGIASEITRLVLYKGKSWISGKGKQKNNTRAVWLQSQYARFMQGISEELEVACAVGGMVFKPYISKNQLFIDTIANDRFIPCSFDLEGNITEAVFLSVAVAGNKYYTRLENHTWNFDCTYKISNRVFVSDNMNSLGTETDLSAVPQWENVEKSKVFNNIKQPLFSYFKLPIANNVDRSSAMGISCYCRAVSQIKQADEQWERTMWEFQGSELAIMAESGMFRVVNGKSDLPCGNERLYRIFQQTDATEMFHEFAPGIRDNSLFNGLNRIFQRIEFN